MRFKYAILAAMVLLFPPEGNAEGIEKRMNDLFGSMTNITNPSVHYESDEAGRGVISGGGITIKTNTMTTQIVNFSPPKLNAGCGGIDFFTGAFSFINAEQAITLLRSIASNASSYFFKMAMKVMCPSCEQLMSDLESLSRELNNLSLNSCEIAQNLLNKAENALPSSVSSALEKGPINQLSLGLGYLADGAQGFLKRSTSSESETSKLTTQELYEHRITGNVAYRVIKDSSLTSWFSYDDGSATFAEQIMSITGTVLIDKPSTADASPNVIPVIPVNGIETLLHGTTDSEISALQCDEYDQCLEPTIKNVSYEGLYAKIKKLLEGDETKSGLVAKYIYNLAGELTNDEKGFIRYVPEHAARLRDLAIKTRAGALTYARAATETIALDIVDKLVTEIFISMASASAAYRHEGTAMLVDQLQATKDSLQAERIAISTKISRYQSLPGLYNSLMTSGAGKGVKATN